MNIKIKQARKKKLDEKKRKHEYYLKNKEKINKLGSEKYYKNTKEINENNKKYRERNKDNFINKRKTKKFKNWHNKYKRAGRRRNPIQYIIESIRSRCKRNNIFFNIKKQDIEINIFCPLLNIPLKTNSLKKHWASMDGYSIDRIFPDKGYIKNNVICVSYKANTMKNNLSIEEIELINKNYFNINNDKLVIDDEIRYKKVLKRMHDHAKERAADKKMEFNIKKSDIIIPKKCPLLNIELSINNKKTLNNSASLDRIDNTKGYIKDNIRVISHKANISKSNSTKEEYDLLAKNLRRIIDNLNKDA